MEFNGNNDLAITVQVMVVNMNKQFAKTYWTWSGELTSAGILALTCCSLQVSHSDYASAVQSFSMLPMYA